MGLRITTNMPALNAQRNLVSSQRAIQTSSAQLASGSRITKSADDAAGLAISESMKAQIRSSAQARRNANDGISLVQTAEGGLSETSNIITRLRELAMQSSSDTVGNNERDMIDKEVQQLKSEVQRIADTTTWNSTKLLDGSTPLFDFQVGINSTENDRIQFDSSKNISTLDGLGLTDLNYSQKESSRQALSLLDTAQSQVSGIRANLGALQNRLMTTTDVLAVTEENLAAANSRIRDTDVAASSTEMARNNLLLQAGVSTLSQANQINQLALKLLA